MAAAGADAEMVATDWEPGTPTTSHVSAPRIAAPYGNPRRSSPLRRRPDSRSHRRPRPVIVKPALRMARTCANAMRHFLRKRLRRRNADGGTLFGIVHEAGK